MRNSKKLIILFLSTIAMLTSCKENRNVENKDINMDTTPGLSERNLQSTAFDTLIDGKKVDLYWIKNDNIEVAITNYGGRIAGLWVPDENGKMTDVVVGMKSIEDFVNSSEAYYGALIGRVGNRIANGKFELEEKEYNIPLNNNGNTLHGGNKGFQAVVWDAEQPNEETLVLKYLSPDMEEGFPGNLDVTVTYSVTEDQSLKIEYEATTDKSTPVNLTSHPFFNLNGEGSGTILNHKLQIFADEYTPVNQALIPTGELATVEGTPFDFRDFHEIGERIESENEQLKNGEGYDHNYVLNKTQVEDLNLAAAVEGDKSGIVMEVLTEEPGMQFYSGNFMEGANTFKSGASDDHRTAFALETQHFPDAPNQPEFPSIILEPGDNYSTLTVYRFSTVKDKN